jgi:hypothetical protein
MMPITILGQNKGSPFHNKLPHRSTAVKRPPEDKMSMNFIFVWKVQTSVSLETKPRWACQSPCLRATSAPGVKERLVSYYLINGLDKKRPKNV